MKLQNLQALRALAALLVVIDHFPRLETKLFGTGILAHIGAAGAIGVDLFFVISGFIMIATTANAFGKPGAAQTFLERRVLRIYPPYWIALTVFVLVGTLAPHAEHIDRLGPFSLVTSYLLIPTVAGPILTVAWSLQCEMYYYLVFTLALSFARTHLRTIVAAWAVVTLALNAISTRVDSVVLHFLGSPLTFEFIAGMGVGMLVLRRRFVAPWIALGVGFVWIAAVCVYSTRFDGFASNELSWYRVLAATPAAAMLVYGAVALEESRIAVVPKVLVAMGDASYTTYLWHGLLLGALTAVFARLHPHGRLADVAFIVVGYAVVIVGSQIVYRLVEEPLLRLFRRAGAGAPRVHLAGSTDRT